MDLEESVNMLNEGDRKELSETSFDDAFELTGHGRFNHLVLLTCGLILLNVSMESVGMSYVITSAECDLDLTSEDKGLVNAAAFIGIMSTSLLWGYLGDRFGRRSVMLPALIASAVVSVMSAFSRNFWMLLILRILTGCLVSASSATVYAYLGEMHTSKHRASAIAWGSVFISFSFIILPGLAWLIIPGKWLLVVGAIRLVPWRIFVAIWCVPGLMAAVALLFLPESPKFVLALRGPDAAMPVLAKMYAYNFRTTPQSFPVKKLTTALKSEGVSSGGFVGLANNICLIFKPPLLRCILISHMSMFAVFMLSSGLYMWVPEILNRILTSTGDEPNSICDIIHDKFENAKNLTVLSKEEGCNSEVSVAVFPISMAMGVVFALTYLAIGVFINKIGKKTLYGAIMIVCGLATIGAGYVPQGAAATGLLILALCAGCAASILAAISVDVFPTSLRAMSMCLMYMVGRAGAAIGAHVLGSLLDRHCLQAFIGFGAFSAGSTILIVFWPKPQKVREQLVSMGLTY